jgi:surface antigen
MLGGLALGTGVASANPAPQAHAAPRYSWVNLDGQWLCRSWSDSAPVASVIVPGAQDSAGATDPTDAPHTVWDLDPTGGRAYGMTGQTTTRCTTHWRIDDALRLVSDDVAWTPNPTGAWPLANDLLTFDRAAHQARPHVRTLTRVVKRHATPATRTTSAPRTPTGGAPGGSTGGSTGGGGSYNPWAPVPGHPTYSMGDFAGDPYASSFGVCTWYAWYRHRSEPLASFGPARNWLAGARAYGLAVGSQPAVGATVVFAPGVEGAGGTGHVGHVEAVLGGSWFMISEMNFYWNGGGWGRVDYRYVYVTSGVSFIY